MDAKQYSEEVLVEQRRQTRALELLAVPQRELQERELHAVFPPLRRVFRGRQGTTALLTGIPGFAECWEAEVPVSHVLECPGRSGGVYRAVRCTCGAMTALDDHTVECWGECGRFFLPLESSVRVKRFEEMGV